MIEPVRQGKELIAEIVETRPAPGTLALWWLGQSGFLIKSHQGLLAVDLYLSEHLTKKYEATSRPHVRMTRAPIRGKDLDEVDLVLASHKHSDHFDPETLPDLMATSNAVLVLPEAIRDHALARSLPANRLIGLDSGDSVERAGFRVRAVPSAHEGLDIDESGRHLYLGYVIESLGLRIYHSGDTLAYEGLCEHLGISRSTSCSCRSTAASPRAAFPETCRPLRRSTLPSDFAHDSSCRIITICLPSIRYQLTSLSKKRAACRRRYRQRSCGAASAGRSCREHHTGNRHRHLGNQDAGHRRARLDPRSGFRGIPLRPPAPRLVRAASAPLVGGDPQDNCRGFGRRQVRRQGCRRHRPERPDARVGVSRFIRRGHPPGFALERSAHGRRMPRNRAKSRRPGSPDSSRRQPGPHRLHRSQDPVGAQA